jgi:hypothetical protein
MAQAQSQFGPPRNAPFSHKIAANSRFLLPTALVVTEHSSKEIALHETFPAFFRLNR